jgi:hypothetical protein
VLIGVFLALTSRSAGTLAANADEPVVLEYSAPAGCESRESFGREIARRAPRARFVEAGDASRRFRVQIVRDGTTFRADLEVRSRDGDPLTRRVSTETCDQATRALALTVALSIDPHASMAPIDRPPAAQEPAPAEAPPPAPAASPTGPTEAATPPPTDKTPPPPAPAAPSSPPAVTRARVPSNWVLSLGADGEALFGVATPLLAFGGHAEVARRRGPSARVSFRRSLVHSVAAGGVSASFDWTFVRVDACPLRFGRAIELAPCAFTDLGELHAQGFGTAASVERQRPWVNVGLLARAQWHFHGLTASADAGLAASINRESFAFQPSPLIYELPALVPVVGLSFGAEWSP